MRETQFGEDKIINAVFAAYPPRRKLFADIGSGGRWSNTDFLEDWAGVQLDKENGEFITAGNVLAYLPGGTEFISIDIDGNDYWIWKAISDYPRLICIEFNPRLISGVTPYRDDFVWSGKDDASYGASKKDLVQLGREKGYILIAQTGDNLFFLSP